MNKRRDLPELRFSRAVSYKLFLSICISKKEAARMEPEAASFWMAEYQCREY
ncbi:hypothetical protein [Paenibacillus shenyangensis]|uniref:hypothetical protein n=1 Tax=Paenibacillus sp. A9 TaxID=1284352 RepID=UPI001EE73818|nr:hypothetical protein [Paenibacillus sp. A9]